VTLAMRIKQLRKRRGLTQATLAKKAGLSLPYVGRLETEQHDPRLSTLKRLAKALAVPVAELLE
jgi:transcriptional regulator with XRE-family HTH domain